MKKEKDKKKTKKSKLLILAELTVFALALAGAYFEHQDEINQSIEKFKASLPEKKNSNEDE